MDLREKCAFAEYVDEVAYIVSVRGLSNATLSCEEYIKKLIIKEAVQLQMEEMTSNTSLQ